MANLQKTNFVREAEQAATIFAQAVSKISALKAVYMAREMYAVGKNPLVDDDLLNSKGDPTSRAVIADAAAIVTFIDFAGELEKFMAGEAIKTPQAWSPTINQIRTDM